MSPIIWFSVYKSIIAAMQELQKCFPLDVMQFSDKCILCKTAVNASKDFKYHKSW